MAGPGSSSADGDHDGLAVSVEDRLRRQAAVAGSYRILEAEGLALERAMRRSSTFTTLG